MEADKSLASRRAGGLLEWIIQQRGAPEALRCDNGPEFTSRRILAWRTTPDSTDSRLTGLPMQNGRVESFNRRLRDECLNALVCDYREWEGED